ncbi:response regulator transcription factor [Paenibacillus glycanilyticus]|uniref:DNA-binding response regulator n=1 Tax=Paenibacillus glycanilyticus TaxID=126569 RepID=A0ABQ6GFH4_9BACL|nr:response regulator [Paenibacillus glycanilyticus]GLX69706.1 DNA-binding response regulator [Paenibacillus glycanilyticus]
MYNLLITDDESEIRNGLSNYFPWHEFGYRVVGQASDGEEALAFIAGQPVDVLLCDIRMPALTGIEVAERLFRQQSEVKVVLLSGFREFEYAQSAMQYGVRRYLTKPTKYAEIAEVFGQLRNELDQTKQLPAVPALAPDIPSGDQTIEKVKAYLHDHLASATLESAARHVFLNPYYLSKYFKTKTGENFSDFLTKLRMDKAAELLRATGSKTYEISEAVGYSNAKNFTRMFRSYFGVTPREYRNED